MGNTHDMKSFFNHYHALASSNKCAYPYSGPGCLRYSCKNFCQTRGRRGWSGGVAKAWQAQRYTCILMRDGATGNFSFCCAFYVGHKHNVNKMQYLWLWTIQLNNLIFKIDFCSWNCKVFFCIPLKPVLGKCWCLRGAHFLHSVSAETHPQTHPPYSAPAKQTKPTNMTITKPSRLGHLFKYCSISDTDALNRHTSALRDWPSIKEGVAFPEIQSTKEENSPRSPW